MSPAGAPFEKLTYPHFYIYGVAFAPENDGEVRFARSRFVKELRLTKVGSFCKNLKF